MNEDRPILAAAKM